MVLWKILIQSYVEFLHDENDVKTIKKIS